MKADLGRLTSFSKKKGGKAFLPLTSLPIFTIF